MKIGYARVSTEEQHLELQLKALKDVGADRIFQEEISNRKSDRPELKRAFDYLTEDHVLVGRFLPNELGC